MNTPSKAEQLEANFISKCNLLKAAINSASITSLPSLSAQLDSLRELVAQGAEWWTKYDIRRNSETLSALELEVDNVRTRLKPRRRFRFTQTPSEVIAQPPKQDAALTPQKAPRAAENGLLIDSASVRNGKIELDSLREQNVSLVGLTNVRVSLKGSLRALRFSQLTRCHVEGAFVDGSVFMSNCDGCDIEVACHQLRIHESHACSLWTCSGSAPIIENCDSMRFGELVLDGRKGCWNDVKDFSWLREGSSPNWQLVSEKRTPRGAQST
ncbi:Tubulin-specific chaperone C [Gracilariopsis chorda]|uniref:Tubulin-specific chaperone C n=1 Tax=Gracilariopsis chorda TaxID=448386 RepID=A0A2V3IZJ8_9FLOR|nr:Tubulin-specific chaperone C [Gracilariopsis chorda]|eukprot:PXF47107.1 Tubulin-specific chaperone C [Gracilariopsis chorda]